MNDMNGERCPDVIARFAILMPTARYAFPHNIPSRYVYQTILAKRTQFRSGRRGPFAVDWLKKIKKRAAAPNERRLDRNLTNVAELPHSGPFWAKGRRKLDFRSLARLGRILSRIEGGGHPDRRSTHNAQERIGTTGPNLWDWIDRKCLG